MSASFIEDSWSKDPQFDFDLIAESLKPLLQARTDGALVLGLHGPWGSGKTTLMQAIARSLGSGQADCADVFIDFNAWKYHEREALWRALILRLIAELRPLVGKDTEAGARLDELTQSLYEAFAVQEKGPWSVNWRVVVTEVITIGLSVIHLDFVGKALAKSASWVAKVFRKKDSDGLDEASIEELGSLLQRETTRRQIVQVQSIEQFLDKFRQVMDGLRGDTDDDGGRRVYVLIDDLDRCLPDAALDIFESIKLFLDAAGCVFIVALDRDVIRKGLRLRYGNAPGGESTLLIDPDQYIEKTISISYDLPRLSNLDVEGIIDSFELPLRLSAHSKKLIISALGTNPRRIKRFMNTLAVQLRLAQLASARGRAIPQDLLSGSTDLFELFVKLLLIAYRYSGFFALTAEDAKLLERLEVVENAAEADRSRRDKLTSHEAPLVRGLIGDELFWALIVASPQVRNTANADVLMRWFRQDAGASG